MTEARDPSAGARAGAWLAEARQAQNLTTADVARRLKLSVGQVEALEAGRFHDLPGPIFVRGFIRNYAKLVRLDPEELLQAAADSLPQPALRPEIPPSQDIPFPGRSARRWPQVVVGIAAIVGLLAVYEFSYNEPARTVVTQPDIEVPTAVPESYTDARPTEEQSSAASKSREASAPIARHSTPAPAERAPTPAEPAPAEPVTPPPVVVVSREERPVHPDEREVRFVFNEESWVEVRDRNDTVIFYQLNASGTARRVSGLPPLSIVVGNAQGVRVTYDGQPVDLARHTKIDVARLTLE